MHYKIDFIISGIESQPEDIQEMIFLNHQHQAMMEIVKTIQLFTKDEEKENGLQGGKRYQSDFVVLHLEQVQHIKDILNAGFVNPEVIRTVMEEILNK